MTIHEAISWANAGLALLACLINLRSAVRGIPPMRVVHGAVAALALLYSGAYAYLAVDLDDRLHHWSEVMHGVSLVVWPAVWIAPALVSAHRYRQVHRRLDDLQASVSAVLYREEKP